MIEIVTGLTSDDRGKQHLWSASIKNLNAFKNRFLELPLNLVTLVIGRRLSVQVKQRTEVELGGLEKLDLADVDLVYG